MRMGNVNGFGMWGGGWGELQPYAQQMPNQMSGPAQFAGPPMGGQLPPQSFGTPQTGGPLPPEQYGGPQMSTPYPPQAFTAPPMSSPTPQRPQFARNDIPRQYGMERMNGFGSYAQRFAP